MSTASQLFPKVPLGALFDLEYGAALPESRRTGSGFPVFGSSGAVGRHSTYFVEGPGIIVGRKGSVGQISWSSDSFWPIDTTYYVVPKEQNSLRWIYWLLSNTALKRLDAATGVPGLNRNDVYTVQAHRPEPTEQFCIAAVLDTMDEAIAKTEAVITKLRQVRAGLLHDLLTRGLDEHGQLRDPIARSEQFQDSPLGRIPYTWRVAQLGAVADIASGVTLGRGLGGAGTLELPYLRVANVQDGYLNLLDVKTVSILPDELERFRLRSGDVLMNEGGDYDKLGRGTVWEDQIPVCLHQNHVFRVRCKPAALNCHFLAAVSGSEIGKSYFLRSSKQSTNLASINSKQLNAFEIPVPDLNEQEAIIDVLKAQDDQITNETRELVKLQHLKSGLMSDLLTGRVRVPEEITVAP